VPGLGYSAHGQAAQVPAAHYTASKAGLHGLTHFLASRLAATGTTVNALAPGAGRRDQDAARRPGPAARQGPAGRLGQPSQAVGLAAAIPAKAYLADQVISPTAASTPDRHRTAFTTARTSWPAPADIRPAVIHDRYHHQDDDRYAAEAGIHPRSDDA
jgi:NAD(P)-dependent dehydrogenase (short-subunit alcohol dehydrogenase family)